MFQMRQKAQYCFGIKLIEGLKSTVSVGKNIVPRYILEVFCPIVYTGNRTK